MIVLTTLLSNIYFNISFFGGGQTTRHTRTTLGIQKLPIEVYAYALH